MFPFGNAMEGKISDLNLVMLKPTKNSPEFETAQLITVLTKGNHKLSPSLATPSQPVSLTL